MLLMFLFLFIINCDCYTNIQWKIINKLCSKVSFKERNTLNLKIYKDHEFYVYHQTSVFLKEKNIELSKKQNEELIDYAFQGLWVAIVKFDGTSNFYSFSSMYISFYLFKGFTDVTPMKLLPHSYRINKKWREKNKELYKKSMKSIHYVSDNFCNNNNDDPYLKIDKEDIQEKLQFLSLVDQRIFFYKYDAFDFRFIRSNKHVGELMCFSEEYVRRRVQIIIEQLKII